MKRLGYSIRLLRQARELTAAQLAARAGVSPAYLSLIERGVRLPPAHTLAKLAGALRVEVELLESFLLNSNPLPRSLRLRKVAESFRRLTDRESTRLNS